MTWDPCWVAEQPIEWDDYRRDVFGDPIIVWHDGADYADLMARWREDRNVVLDMLRKGLRNGGDPLAASSVIQLHRSGADVGVLVNDLTAAARQASGETEAAVAQALFELTGEQRWCGVVLRVLATDPSEFTRLAAADMAGQLPATDEVLLALGLAVRDRDYLVRYHAVSALCAFAGRRFGVDGLARDLVETISGRSKRRKLRTLSVELAEACGAGSPVVARLKKR